MEERRMRKEKQQLRKGHLQTGENTARHPGDPQVESSGQEGVETNSPSFNYSRAKSTLDRIARTMKKL